MGDVKTKPNNASVMDFLNAVPEEAKRRDSLTLLKLFVETTGEKAKMWGTSIVGFGMYHYKSERSSQEGDWPLTGFSPRKQALTLYILRDFEEGEKLLKKLGKHATSKACLYIKKLSDVDMGVLEELIKKSFVETQKRYKS